MTVEELIERLKYFSPKAKVLRTVDELGGYENIFDVTSEMVVDNFSSDKQEGQVVVLK